MFKDKSPKKWSILIALFIITILALVIFFGLQASAKDKNSSDKLASLQGSGNSPERFLPIEVVKTPGGLTYWIAKNHTLPIIAIRFYFRDAGSTLDGPAKQGLAQLLSNTMDEGAGSLDSQSFQKALSDHSIELSFNASRDAFGGQVQSLKRNEGKALELLALAIGSPRFDNEPIARMKAANISRIRQSISQPEWLAARLINDKSFVGHPYALNSGGTLSTLPTITADDLKSFKAENMTKDRLTISVSGDVDAQEIGPALDHIFGGLPAHSESSSIPDVTLQNGGKTFLYKQPIPQTVIQATLPAFGQKDKDYYALQVLNYIYGGAGFGSRLMEEAREKRGLTYGIYSSVDSYRHGYVLSISTSTKNESAPEMVEIITREMKRLQNEKISDQELADAKSYITGSMPLLLTSTGKVADMLAQLQIEDLPADYLDHFAENIRAVSAEDVQRVAKRILKPESLVIALVGSPAPIQNLEEVKKIPNVQ